MALKSPRQVLLHFHKLLVPAPDGCSVCPQLPDGEGASSRRTKKFKFSHAGAHCLTLGMPDAPSSMLEVASIG